MTQGKLGDGIYVVLGNCAGAAPGRMGTGSTQPHQVGTHAVDTCGEATLGNGCQRLVIQRYLAEQCAGLLTPCAQGILMAGPAGAKALRISVKIQTPTNDFAAFGR